MRSCSFQVFVGLAEFVAELGSLLVLGLPAHEARPVREEGFVDDSRPGGWDRARPREPRSM